MSDVVDTVLVAGGEVVPQSSPEIVITAQGLTKRYGQFTAVDGLDLSIERGEIFGLLGPNGAGKTTTILMLLGLTEPTAGSVRVAGFDPVRDPLSVKTVVGYLPDNVGFYPNMTGKQNLLYTASLNRIPRKEAEERADLLLQDVGLAEAAGKRAGKYSRGMRQRLAVADALIKRPSVLILDEPTIGIDPEGVRELLAMLARLKQEEGMTILLSSHLLHQVQEVCDRVGIFVGGHLIAAGPVAELERELAREGDLEFRVSVVGPDGREASDSLLEELAREMRTLDGVGEVSAVRGTFTVTAAHDVRTAMAQAVIGKGLLPISLSQRGMSLDDIYDRYFREEANA
ncbi:MAG: ABC transporter ATP-binding protein [Actinobacteria bacterium]|nr:ABC transporter ATP-binding protein [Actinomycetota bacterium]